MNEWVLAAGTALWLGILTSISPCPLASNIAAISFIGRRVDRPGYVLATGLFYTAGRALTYMLLAAVLVAGLLSVPGVAHWLQKYMHRLLGPVLILAGMVLLDLLTFTPKGSNLGQWCQRNAERFGLGSALLLGCLFALSFCPVSAALFFASLLPLAVKQSSPFLLPLLYGIGTALPVVGFALLLALGAGRVARVFEKITVFERWARRVTGILFIAVGIWFTLAYTIGLKG